MTHWLHFDPAPRVRGAVRYEQCGRCSARRTTVEYQLSSPPTGVVEGWPLPDADQLERGWRVSARTICSGWRQPPLGVWPNPGADVDGQWIKFIAENELFPDAREASRRLREEDDE